jgi:hypothetical protein
MTSNNVKIAKKNITRELLDFIRFHVDVKNIKNPLQWWEKPESRFFAIGFLAKQILKIVGSQIEIELIFFSLVGILTSFRKCSLQFEILDN